jgi:hypothetical protein
MYQKISLLSTIYQWSSSGKNPLHFWVMGMIIDWLFASFEICALLGPSVEEAASFGER